MTVKEGDIKGKPILDVAERSVNGKKKTVLLGSAGFLYICQ